MIGHTSPSRTVDLSDTDFALEARTADDDPPFQAPASWHRQAPVPRKANLWDWSERSTAAFLGFAAGVLIIVPTVLFIGTGADNGAPAQPIAPTAPAKLTQAIATANITAVPVANLTTGNWFDSKPIQSSDASAQAHPPATNAVSARHHETTSLKVEKHARSAIAKGRIADARSALRAAASPDTPRLWLVLAETYDPGMSAGPDKSLTDSASDNLTSADIKFARFYYQQALTHGIDEARERLQRLPRP